MAASCLVADAEAMSLVFPVSVFPISAARVATFRHPACAPRRAFAGPIAGNAWPFQEKAEQLLPWDSPWLPIATSRPARIWRRSMQPFSFFSGDIRRFQVRTPPSGIPVRHRAAGNPGKPRLRRRRTAAASRRRATRREAFSRPSPLQHGVERNPFFAHCHQRYIDDLGASFAGNVCLGDRHDQKTVAPGRDLLRKLLERASPYAFAGMKERNAMESVNGQ